MDSENVNAGAHQYPKTGNFRFTEAVSSKGLSEVNRIRDEALAAGWTEAQLYQNKAQLKFPSSVDYGLVCFVKGNRHISRVTKTSIRIENDLGIQFTFYNMKDDSNPAVTLIESKKGRRTGV